jgi:CRP-like cAMP-binding protein
MSTTIKLFRNDENAVDYEAGQVIFNQGDQGDCMYVILEGDVRIETTDRLIDTISEGEIFGEMALVDDSPRSASAVADSRCKVVPIDKSRFTRATQINPYFALQVMGVMAQRLRNLMEA